MTFKEWAGDTARRYRRDSIGEATAESARRLARGAARRAQPATRRVIPSVWDRGDWNVLVILDACRVDLMREVAPEYDRLASREVDAVWSQGSTSIDWINSTFNHSDQDLSNVAYISANPFADNDSEHNRSADLGDSDLAHFEPAYYYDWHEIGGIETVPPEWLTNRAIRSWRRRRELGFNRMVIHYMQPHEPYITRPEWSWTDDVGSGFLKNLLSDEYEAGASPWDVAMADEDTALEELVSAYRDNLRWVLNDVTARLLQNIDADVVISADHGNGLGEYGVWQHPPGTFSPHVRKVPWLEVCATDHGTVEPRSRNGGTQTDIEDRLGALGYR